MADPSEDDVGAEPALRLVYVTDTMADLRMIEGLAGDQPITLLVPASLGDDATNWWPPRQADVRRVDLPGGRVGFVGRAARWLRAHRHEIDAAIVLDNLVAALAANLGRRIGGPPVVLQIGRPTVEYVRAQQGEEPWLRHQLRLVIARSLVALNERAADGIGAVSDYVADQCRRHNPHTVFIPAYGVDPEVFKASCTRAEARTRIGLPVDPPMVMWRSRLAPEKDLDTFLDAVRHLRAEGRELTAVYMGGEYPEVLRRAEAAGVEMIGRKPSTLEEIPLWYVAADVDVQTSKTEGLGMSPLEALACGTPIVVTDVGGLRQVADDGRCGLLVPRGDGAATAAAIGRLLDDPELAAQIATDGREWVQQRFATADTFRSWRKLAAASAGRPIRHRGVPRRVLFVDHETRLSGGERDLVDLIAALDPTEVEAHVALPGEGRLADAVREAGAEVHLVEMGRQLRSVSRWDLARRPWSALPQIGAATGAARRLARLAAQLQPDVVHSNSMKAHVLSVPAARKVGVPLVWHVRDILDGLVLRGVVAAGRSADRIVCLSEAAAAPFADTAVASKVRVVHNGIHAPQLDPAEAQRWRDRLGAGAPFPDGAPLIGIVGQLSHWKGQDVFCDAAERVLDQWPAARFVIVGECLFPENEAAYTEALEARAADGALAGHLTLTGQVEPVQPLMAALDLLVHASRLPEPFGRVIVEAMALGTPVVTTSIGAGPELVPDEPGWIVSPDDPAVLASAIGGWLADPERLAVAGKAGQEAAARFGIDRTAAKVLSLYDDLGI